MVNEVQPGSRLGGCRESDCAVLEPDAAHIRLSGFHRTFDPDGSARPCNHVFFGPRAFQLIDERNPVADCHQVLI